MSETWDGPGTTDVMFGRAQTTAVGKDRLRPVFGLATGGIVAASLWALIAWLAYSILT